MLQDRVQRNLQEKGARPDQQEASERRQIETITRDRIGHYDQCYRRYKLDQHEGPNDKPGSDGVGEFISHESLLGNLTEKRVMDDLHKPDNTGHHGGGCKLDKQQNSGRGKLEFHDRHSNRSDRDCREEIGCLPFNPFPLKKRNLP